MQMHVQHMERACERARERERKGEGEREREMLCEGNGSSENTHGF